MADQIFIQRRFQIVKDGISLSDALILPKAEYEALSTDQIEVLKQERLTNHIERIKNPPVQFEPTPEQVLADIDTQLFELSSKRTEVEERVQVKPEKNTTISFHKGGSK